jgi:tetratricopeptide (TPR) repeat protein
MQYRRPGHLTSILLTFLLVTTAITVSCSAQTEEQALKSLREMTRDGKLPPEDYVAGIESRFSGRKTGALAKLLHARIRFENNDFASAATILNTDMIAKQTRLGDYALWLRGKALQGAANHAETMNAFSALLRDYPDSVRTRDAKILWATSALAAGKVSDVPGFLVDLTQKNDADALLLTAKAYEAQGSQPEAFKYYRRTYFFGAGTNAAKEAEIKLTTLAQPLTPQTAEEFGGDECLQSTRRGFSGCGYAGGSSETIDRSVGVEKGSRSTNGIQRDPIDSR